MAKKYREVDAYNQGTTNAMHQTQLEQIMPQVHVNRMDGRLEFSGYGKNPLTDQGTGAALDPKKMVAMHADYHKMAYDQEIARGMSPENAMKFANHELGLYEPTDPKSKISQAQQMQRANAGEKFKQGGQVLPAMPDYGYGY